MIAYVLNLTKWEWYKLRRRRMPWILLAIALLAPQVTYWYSYALSQSGVMLGQAATSFAGSDADGKTVEVHVTCRDLASGSLPPEVEELSTSSRERFLDHIEKYRADTCESLEADQRVLKQASVLPLSIVNSLGFAHALGVILIMLLAVIVIGIEYESGGLRIAHAMGVGYRRLLASKAILIALWGAAAFLAVSIAIAVGSLIVSALTAVDGGGFAGSAEWSEVAIRYGKSIYGLIPYIVLAMLMAISTPSIQMAISNALGYYFVDQILVALLGRFDEFRGVSDFFLSRAVSGWMEGDVVLVRVVPEGIGKLPGALHASLVMLGYIVVIGGFTFWLYRRRGLAGVRRG